MAKFPCTGCGLCCYHPIAKVAALQVLWPNIPDFPYPEVEGGRCSQLVDSDHGVKVCGIYDKRPVVCNISRFAKKNDIPIETMFLANAMECNRLVRDAGLGEEFLIPIKKDPAKENTQGGVE